MRSTVKIWIIKIVIKKFCLSDFIIMYILRPREFQTGMDQILSLAVLFYYFWINEIKLKKNEICHDIVTDQKIKRHPWFIFKCSSFFWKKYNRRNEIFFRNFITLCLGNDWNFKKKDYMPLFLLVICVLEVG